MLYRRGPDGVGKQLYVISTVWQSRMQEKNEEEEEEEEKTLYESQWAF